MLYFSAIFIVSFALGFLCVLSLFFIISFLWRFKKMKKTFKQKITDYLNSLCDELRSSIDHNKNKPRTPRLHKLGSLAIVLCTIIYLCIGCFGGIKSSAAEVPSNLTGYTVSVPSGWTASAGYGNFSIDFLWGSNLSNSGSSLGIGYDFMGMPSPDTISIDSGSSELMGDSFNLKVLAGDDVSNASLIQWFVDNNATFVNNNVPSTVTVPAGLYFLQNTFNDLRGTINFSVPFISRSSYFTSIEFVGVENDQYVSINYVDAQDNITDVYYATEGWQENEYSVILIQSDIELNEAEYDLFSSAFVSFADNPDLDTLFKAGQENGQSFGYSQGYDSGYTVGYDEGRTAGVAEGMENGFMSNFFGGIVQALDALKLFGNFSVLNIIEGVLGLMLALWVLKLIAGG